jgi:hypothetical protein
VQWLFFRDWSRDSRLVLLPAALKINQSSPRASSSLQRKSKRLYFLYILERTPLRKIIRSQPITADDSSRELLPCLAIISNWPPSQLRRSRRVSAGCEIACGAFDAKRLVAAAFLLRARCFQFMSKGGWCRAFDVVCECVFFLFPAHTLLMHDSTATFILGGPIN